MTTVKTIIGALWMMLMIDAIPGMALLREDNPARWLLLSVAITASLACCVRCLQRPATEIFDAGREYERRLMLREMNECKVLPFQRDEA